MFRFGNNVIIMHIIVKYLDIHKTVVASYGAMLKIL